MRKDNRRLVEKPKYVKLFAKRLAVFTVSAVVIFFVMLLIMRGNYNKYVDNLFDNLLYNFKQETAQIYEHEINEILRQNPDAEYFNYFEIKKNIVTQIDEKYNDRVNEMSPVEIEIFDSDYSFECSNLKRNPAYESYINSCTKVKPSSYSRIDGGLDCYYKITARYNFWHDCAKRITMCGLILLGIDILVSFILSVGVYYRRKTEYDNYKYRRNIMNSMAHDLKSPLMIISGYTQNLLEIPHPEIEQHFLQNIQDTVTYMDRVIVNSLELYKLEESTDSVVSKSDMSLDSLIEDVLKRHKKELDERALSVEMTGKININADVILMEKIIENIISNIISYARPQSDVAIDIKETEIIFTNEFPGTMHVEPEQLFVPFVKSDKSRSGQSGTGLGLSIVRQMCMLQDFVTEIEVNDNIFKLIIKFTK